MFFEWMSVGTGHSKKQSCDDGSQPPFCLSITCHILSITCHHTPPLPPLCRQQAPAAATGCKTSSTRPLLLLPPPPPRQRRRCRCFRGGGSCLLLTGLAHGAVGWWRSREGRLGEGNERDGGGRIGPQVRKKCHVAGLSACKVMISLFQKLLTDKELTPPDDWDPPIGYSRNTWGNIVHNKVRFSCDLTLKRHGDSLHRP